MTRCFLVLVVLSILSPCSRASQDAAAPALLDRLVWLSGCWEGTDAGRQYREHWMKPAGDAMLGVSQTVVRGKTTEYEFLQIRQETGGVFYVAKPSGQAEASFRLIDHGADRAIFENPDHDFPQRIIYRLEADGGLVARIEGREHGTTKEFDYPMIRVRCD